MKNITYKNLDNSKDDYEFTFRGVPVHGSVSSFLGDQAVDYMTDLLFALADQVDILDIQTGDDQGLTPGEYCSARVQVKDAKEDAPKLFDATIAKVLANLG